MREVHADMDTQTLSMHVDGQALSMQLLDMRPYQPWQLWECG